MPKNLRSYIDQLKKHMPPQIITVKKTIDSKFEVTAFLQHLENLGSSSTIHFLDVLDLKGQGGHEVLANVTASTSTFSLALGMGSGPWRAEHTAEISKRTEQPIPPRIVTKDQAPVKQIVTKGKELDLRNLPILTQHEGDGGPYLTNPVILRHPSSGIATSVYNVAFNRMMLRSANETSIFFELPFHNYLIYRSYEARNEACPAVVVLGHHPAFLFAAAMRPAVRTSEYGIAGVLLGEPLRLTPSETWGKDFLVPADAEAVIEGEVLPHKRKKEGPFGEFTGYYGEETMSPLFKALAITSRKEPIMVSHFSGHHDDNLAFGFSFVSTIYQMVSRVVPTVLDIRIPESGRGYVVYIKLRKTSEGDPTNAALAASAFGYPKFIVVVDEDIDIFNDEKVLWAIATRSQPDAQQVIKGIKGSQLDPSLVSPPTHSTVILDATRKIGKSYPKTSSVPVRVMKRIKIADYVDFRAHQSR